MKVKKAVIPAAGLGTRMLPASKTVPKEMINIVDKPAIQYIVEEIVKSGITDICIVTGRGKATMEDHFDYAPELEDRLAASKKDSQLAAMRQIAEMANIVYIRQKEAKGLGHAVYCAKPFVGDEPFAVLLGDDIVKSEGDPATKQLCDAYDQYGLSVLGVQKVELSEIGRYGCVKPEMLSQRAMKVLDMVEKPRPEQVFSPYAALGRYVLSGEVFTKLENTKPGVGGEIQLTDALKELAFDNKLIAYDFEGRRFDTGSKLGYLEAVVEYALCHEEVAEGFKEYLKRIAASL